eukprot:scaffold121844_cov18-Prasinocladus_malaysianus.AAC.1
MADGLPALPSGKSLKWHLGQSEGLHEFASPSYYRLHQIKQNQRTKALICSIRLERHVTGQLALSSTRDRPFSLMTTSTASNPSVAKVLFWPTSRIVSWGRDRSTEATAAQPSLSKCCSTCKEWPTPNVSSHAKLTGTQST